MRRYPTGVTLLTTCDGKRIHGMTANSFTSVSLNPTLVLVCITQSNATHELVARTGIFALNVLAEDQEYIARRFARQTAYNAQSVDPFADLPYHRSETGAPILNAGIAYLDCRVVAAHNAGDHTIFIGAVVAAGFGEARNASPLLWLDGKYAALDQNNAENYLLSQMA